jgi:hypothetical protein
MNDRYEGDRVPWMGVIDVFMNGDTMRGKLKAVGDFGGLSFDSNDWQRDSR